MADDGEWIPEVVIDDFIAQLKKTPMDRRNAEFYLFNRWPRFEPATIPKVFDRILLCGKVVFDAEKDKFAILRRHIVKRKPYWLYASQVKEAWEAEQDETWRRMEKLSYALALRNAELRHMTVESFDFEHGVVKVIGGKKRAATDFDLVKVSPSVLAIVREQMESLGVEEGLMFPSTRGSGGPFSDRALRKHAKDLFTSCGFQLSERGNWHTWRHSIATFFAAKGWSLIKLAKFLRHRTTRTVEVYAHIAVDDYATDYDRDIGEIEGLAVPVPVPSKHEDAPDVLDDA